MAIVVQLDEFKRRRRLQAASAVWRRNFPEELSTHTRLRDLEPATLIGLAGPGDDSAAVLNTLIIAFLGWDRETAEGLEKSTQTAILDIYLFLADQIRFEIMVRLGWLKGGREGDRSLFEMVTEFESAKSESLRRPPQLASTHPRFREYQALFERDQQVFIRRLVPMALEVFKNALPPP
jgi:hypothetical protein